MSCTYGWPPCGASPTRRFSPGPRCPAHTPAALAGLPEPDTARYCPPRRCYCGHCPSYRPRVPYEAAGFTPTDWRAIASGARRTGDLALYREAQARVAAARRRGGRRG